ncbi:MAG TPA: GGDEF domain-containing protein, partial [Geobacteraceae bacterium]|nr:GGDEF domain-containing protein [Geobacteraceae bacterium]
SLAYLDLDNFKQINDTYGHAAGDALLKSIVGNIVGHLRRTDVVGRLGGDEFAIFFPATDQSLVQVVVQKVRNELTEMMKECTWPTTFSMGVVTCTGCIHDLEKLISYADMLMYEVKRAGKNDIRFAVYAPESSPEQEP